jgi:hypothetical protein
MNIKDTAVKSIWYVAWTEYRGHDCNGCRMFNLYNGTREDAEVYANSLNEDAYEPITVKEFDPAALNRKGVIF